MTTRPGCSTAKRLLKCFCGCKELTAEEVERIYRLSPQETLINKEASELFHKFLEKERQEGDKSSAEVFLTIYEICEKYIGDTSRVLTGDDVETLSDNGLEYHHEKELISCIRTADRYSIEMCLRRIQENCRNSIKISEEYKNFKLAIKNKLKQR